MIDNKRILQKKIVARQKSLEARKKWLRLSLFQFRLCEWRKKM